jgi:hypothetical protein
VAGGFYTGFGWAVAGENREMGAILKTKKARRIGRAFG